MYGKVIALVVILAAVATAEPNPEPAPQPEPGYVNKFGNYVPTVEDYAYPRGYLYNPAYYPYSPYVDYPYQPYVYARSSVVYPYI